MNTTTKNPAALPVMESFYTIQGEGFWQGNAAYFIRLGGCDVGCHWCDVKESWDAGKHPSIAIEKIIDEASVHPGRLAVITGGEPLMYDLNQLTESLHQEGFRTHIETSGAYQLSGHWDWICLSPKKFKEPVQSIFPFVNELKAIIYNKSDFEFAEKYFKEIAKHQSTHIKHFYLQPEWSKEKEMLPLIIDYVKDHPQWKISLQVHKYMNIP